MIQSTRMIKSIFTVAFLLCALAVSARETGVLKVVANRDKIEITIAKSTSPVRIVELQPFERTKSSIEKEPLVELDKTRRRTISIPRFDGQRDRIYSGFVAVNHSQPIGTKKFVEEWKGWISRCSAPVAAFRRNLHQPQSRLALSWWIIPVHSAWMIRQ